MLLGVQIGTATMETMELCMKLPHKMKIDLPQEPAISLLEYTQIVLYLTTETLAWFCFVQVKIYFPIKYIFIKHKY